MLSAEGMVCERSLFKRVLFPVRIIYACVTVSYVTQSKLSSIATYVVLDGWLAVLVIEHWFASNCWSTPVRLTWPLKLDFVKLLGAVWSPGGIKLEEETCRGLC